MLKTEIDGTTARIKGELSDGRAVDLVVKHGDRITAKIGYELLTGTVSGFEHYGQRLCIDFKQDIPQCLGRFCYTHQIIKLNENLIK